MLPRLGIGPRKALALVPKSPDAHVWLCRTAKAETAAIHKRAKSWHETWRIHHNVQAPATGVV